MNMCLRQTVWYKTTGAYKRRRGLNVYYMIFPNGVIKVHTVTAESDVLPIMQAQLPDLEVSPRQFREYEQIAKRNKHIK